MYVGSRDSLVSIVTCYGLDSLGFKNLHGGVTFQAHLAFCTMCIGSLSQE
jgi:hypothetical protein